ncbi:MAG: NUDIX domain-containing protein [Sphingobacteriales bacterium]|nr:MAG: NUDIX domain-containing protein [Sphingobacteriales bacterium]
MVQITFNERLLELTEDSNDAGHALKTPKQLDVAIAAFASSNEPGARIALTPGLDWKGLFTVWPTGGGAVRNKEGKFLLIRRLGWWDLPKGKLDPGETLEECALREVREETGVGDLHLLRPLLVTLHCYEEKGKRILKENHWYAMETGYSGPLKAQEEEDITECVWADEAGIRDRWSGMYRAVRQVLEAALKG